VKPASSAISSSVAAWNPRRRKTVRAAASSSARVRALLSLLEMRAIVFLIPLVL
jgi:hypothetical protein